MKRGKTQSLAPYISSIYYLGLTAKLHNYILII
jgi:hypothetical protein